MSTKLFLPFVLLFAVGSSASAAPRDDFLIVPGKSVGQITAEASESSLRALYGDKRVKSVRVSLGEGFVCAGSRVLFKDGGYLEITWLDPIAKASPVAIHVKGHKWKTVDGVGLGTNLRQLEKINGKPFRLFGFGWDYSGTISSWEGGKLEKTKGGIILSLSPRTKDSQDFTPEEAQVLGERLFLSSHPAMRKLNPRPWRLIVALAPGKYCKEVKR